MSKRFKTVHHTVTVADAISAFYSDVHDIASEVRAAYENMPESLQSGSRGTALEETADALDQVEEKQLPDWAAELFKDVQLTVATDQLYGRRAGSESRSMRMTNAAGFAEAAITHLRDWCDDIETRIADKTLPEGAGSAEAHRLAVEEFRGLCDGIEGDMEEAGSVEFPGMYG